MKFEVSSEEELDEVAEALLPQLAKTPIVLFKGDLGAGKTTLIKRIAQKLGVESDMSSPSFGLVNQYETSDKTIYHIDLYRINNVSEVFEFGLPEILDSGSYCFVEWPEMVDQIWHEYEFTTVHITMQNRDSRRIFVE